MTKAKALKTAKVEEVSLPQSAEKLNLKLMVVRLLLKVVEDYKNKLKF